ncbi:MAG: aquaporin [Verrucomicrobiales bacterium]|nr:aquaporin [Verrucomicrobiales bacterium]
MNKKHIVEFIGTFFLVFTVGCAAVLGLADKMAPLAIGSVLMVMIFAGGHVSGAHYNPAVSLAVLLRGKLTSKELPGYLIAQVLGAVLAALFVMRVVNGGAKLPSPTEMALMPALFAEFVFTFGLCYVVLNVATAKGTAGNSFYGLAIGFTVMAGAFAVGRVSGGVFNPAVGVGLVVMKAMAVKTLLMYILAQLAAAFVASAVFHKTNGDD